MNGEQEVPVPLPSREFTFLQINVFGIHGFTWRLLLQYSLIFLKTIHVPINSF